MDYIWYCYDLFLACMSRCLILGLLHCICPLTFYQTSLDILEIYSYTFGIFLPLYDYIVLTMSPAACCTVVCELAGPSGGK